MRYTVVDTAAILRANAAALRAQLPVCADPDQARTIAAALVAIGQALDHLQERITHG